MYAYFLAGPLSYTAVVSAVDAAAATRTTTTTSISNRNTTVTRVDREYVSNRLSGGEGGGGQYLIDKIERLLFYKGCEYFIERSHYSI